jgi:hypothetical protein
MIKFKKIVKFVHYYHQSDLKFVFVNVRFRRVEMARFFKSLRILGTSFMNLLAKITL